MSVLERVQELTFRYRAVLMALVVLVVLYFAKPTWSSLLASLPLVILGEGIRIWGLGYIGTDSRGVETATSELVTAGPYAYTRNPLYWGNTLTGLGLTLGAVGDMDWSLKAFWLGLVMVTYITVYWLLSVPHEERYLERTFGEDYQRYRRAVPKWWWRLRPYEHRKGAFKFDSVLRTESWTVLWILLIYAVLMWKAMTP